MDSYLVPANAKRGMLILGKFKIRDLILAGTGILISVFLIIIKENPNFTWITVSLMPGFIATGLVIPIPNYHNILTILINAFMFFLNRRIYIWKGWCIYDTKEYEESNNV